MKLFFLFSFIVPVICMAETKILKQNLKVHTDLCNDGKCQLTKVFFWEQHRSTQDAGIPVPDHGSIFKAGFEAKNWNDLQKYGFVQFIRGCTFDSAEKANGIIERWVGDVTRNFGKRITNTYPRWTFNTPTSDPLLDAPHEDDLSLPGGRLRDYEWSAQMIEPVIQKRMKLKTILEYPPRMTTITPRLSITFLPATMAYMNTENSHFRNVAFEYKICLYHLKDIPLHVTEDSKMPEAIVCQDWDSQFEYDFKSKEYKFRPNAGLHDFCAGEEPLDLSKL